MAGVEDKREVTAITRGISLGPAVVQKVLWLSALFEQLARTTATELVNYQTDMVCKAAPAMHEKIYYSICWCALLLLAFAGGWLTGSCQGRATTTPRAAETPGVYTEGGQRIIKRTMRTQSMVTYHRNWAQPRFAVLAEPQQGAWPEALVLSN